MIRGISCWEEYEVYIAKKKKEAIKRESRVLKKKEKLRLLKQHNSSIKGIAKKYAEEMQRNPSELEKKMKLFLDNNNVVYDFQRVFTIPDRNGKIIRFFIADFYIPAKNLIIETDGKFHREQSAYDEIRSQLLQYYYPNVKILRWEWHDFQSLRKLKELTAIIKK